MHLQRNRVKWGAALGHLLPVRNRATPALKRRRASAVLLLPALLWIFTQLVMSGFILHPSAARADGLHSVTICTGSALITLTVDDNGQPVKGHPAQKSTCPWCAQFGGVAPVPLPDLTLVAAPCSDVQQLSLAKAQQTGRSLSQTPYASRAPPVSTRL